VIYEEDGEPRQYWRGEGPDGVVAWFSQPQLPGQSAAGKPMSTEEMLKAIEASLRERRSAGRGRTFRL